MNYTLEKGKKSNYSVMFTATPTELNAASMNFLKEVQKDFTIKGFRKGFVPLDVVKSNLNPAYINVGTYENLINTVFRKVIQDNPTIKFIGEIYGLDTKQNGDNVEMSFKIDTYPEITIKNDNWKTVTISSVNTNVTEEEINDVLKREKARIAKYEPQDVVDKDSIVRMEIEYTLNGKVVDKKTRLVYNDEIEQFPEFLSAIVGKKKNDTTTLSADNIPPVLTSEKEYDSATITVLDSLRMDVPEFTDEKITEITGGEITTYDEYISLIKEHLGNFKQRNEISKAIDDYISHIKDSFDIEVPQTIVEHEKKRRLDEMNKQYGDANGLEQYKQAVGEEKYNEFVDSIAKSSEESLEKTFILMRILEELHIAYDQHQDLEQVVYDNLHK